jgi:fructokinase
MARLGIDLGGTKIEVAALAHDGAVAFRRRIATPSGDYDATIAAIASLVEAAERAVGERGSLGIATPGARSLATGFIKNSNSTCLNGRPLKEDLEARLQREVRVENDANCFALSEAIDGAARGARVVFGVILGTGVGGGIVVDGRVLTGANAIAGEWGHNPLPLPRPEDEPLRPCYCGKRACIETYLSGPALAADRRDLPAGQALARYEERLARSLAGVVNILDPDVIVLGGGLSAIPSLYENVPRLWGAHVFSDEIRTRLVPPMHGDSSGVRGAARLWE